MIDTTGAGDCFYAGLIAGLSAGLSVADAGRIGAAAGACCVTGVGASSGLREFKATGIGGRETGLAEFADDCTVKRLLRWWKFVPQFVAFGFQIVGVVFIGRW